MQHSGGGSSGITDVKPMPNIRGTFLRRALQQIVATFIAPDFNLSTAKEAIADHADPLVIQRMPLPLSLVCTQNLEPLLKSKMFLHFVR